MSTSLAERLAAGEDPVQDDDAAPTAVEDQTPDDADATPSPDAGGAEPDPDPDGGAPADDSGPDAEPEGGEADDENRDWVKEYATTEFGTDTSRYVDDRAFILSGLNAQKELGRRNEDALSWRQLAESLSPEQLQALRAGSPPPAASTSPGAPTRPPVRYDLKWFEIDSATGREKLAPGAPAHAAQGRADFMQFFVDEFNATPGTYADRQATRTADREKEATERNQAQQQYETQQATQQDEAAFNALIDEAAEMLFVEPGNVDNAAMTDEGVAIQAEYDVLRPVEEGEAANPYAVPAGQKAAALRRAIQIVQARRQPLPKVAVPRRATRKPAAKRLPADKRTNDQVAVDMRRKGKTLSEIAAVLESRG